MVAALFDLVPLGLERAPVAVGAGADTDEGGDEDGGSEDSDDESEVHTCFSCGARDRAGRDCGALLQRDYKCVRVGCGYVSSVGAEMRS